MQAAAKTVIDTFQDRINQAKKVGAVLEKVLPKVDPVNGAAIAKAVDGTIKVVEAGARGRQGDQGRWLDHQRLGECRGRCRHGQTSSARPSTWFRDFLSFGQKQPPSEIDQEADRRPAQGHEHSVRPGRQEALDTILDTVETGLSKIDTRLQRVEGDLQVVSEQMVFGVGHAGRLRTPPR
jgi:hypothetical protein